MKLVFVALFLFVSLQSVNSLSCVCGIQPCQLPTCCESGLYVKDECGCCLRCAKAEGNICGGPFGISGLCARGTSCLKKCECKTFSGKSCLFPFTFEGETYTNCTTVKSENGQPWCATRVDKDGQVVTNAWEDCESGCPGTDFECDKFFLSNNADGRCVKSSEAPNLLQQAAQGRTVATLDEDFSGNFIEAPRCQQPSGRDVLKSCRCSRDPAVRGLDGQLKGGCQPPLDAPAEELENGWCFLENIQNPENPQENCYEDMQWSISDGRWWSNMACNEESAKPAAPGARSDVDEGFLSSLDDEAINFQS